MENPLPCFLLERVGFHDIHAAAKQGLKIGHKAARKPGRSGTLDFNKKVYVASVIGLALGKGSEHANPADTVVPGDPENGFTPKPETNVPARALRRVGRGGISKMRDMAVVPLSSSSLTDLVRALWCPRCLLANKRFIPRSGRGRKQEQSTRQPRKTTGGRYHRPPVWYARLGCRDYFSPISLTLTSPFRAAWAAASLAMGTR